MSGTDGEIQVKLKVNGRMREVRVKPNERLIDTLREKLGLKSVKMGCLTGECGTCTVLYNGQPVKSCLVLTAEADGKEVITVEGLAGSDEMRRITEVFARNNAFQCGFCTPAFVLLAYWLMKVKPKATDEEILEASNSILCRCTGYTQILQALKEAISRV
ncbi:MAG TPA: (2Fe-2S)-binding protein [Fervidicoccus fontis]|uniref:(2Fe-2S)-binding protein n=1 Tax=Fervidicoccus fontis TaxID=683846 RepID=A0A7C2UTV3_9CREN|nr:MAG: xanthine dehydrogenase [Fervidicoccus sp.]HEU97423.1 (2Fe-2S)-binding protein [Fervidicoccus fontis]